MQIKMYQWELIVQATVTKIWRSGHQKKKFHTLLNLGDRIITAPTQPQHEKEVTT